MTLDEAELDDHRPIDDQEEQHPQVTANKEDEEQKI